MNSELTIENANLIYFLKTQWKSAFANEPSGRFPRLDQIYSNAVRIEAYLWLVLGVANGFFPRELSERVIQEYAKQLIAARLELRKSGYEFLFPRDFDSAFEFLTDKVRFSYLLDQPSSAHMSRPRFGHFIGLSTQLHKSRAAALFTQLINFSNDLEWESNLNTLREFASSGLLETAQQLQTRLAQEEEIRETFFEGLLATVRFMEAWSESLRRTSDSVQLPADVKSLVDIQKWRINFSVDRTWNRFSTLSDTILTWRLSDDSKRGKYERDLTVMNVVSETLLEIQALATAWGAPEISEPAAGASATAST